MDKLSELKARHRQLLEADELWSAALVKAFGSDAGDRRYDSDKHAHPFACREAHNYKQACNDRFEEIGGFPALCGHA